MKTACRSLHPSRSVTYREIMMNLRQTHYKLFIKVLMLEIELVVVGVCQALEQSVWMVSMMCPKYGCIMRSVCDWMWEVYEGAVGMLNQILLVRKDILFWGTADRMLIPSLILRLFVLFFLGFLWTFWILQDFVWQALQQSWIGMECFGGFCGDGCVMSVRHLWDSFWKYCKAYVVCYGSVLFYLCSSKCSLLWSGRIDSLDACQSDYDGSMGCH